MANEDRTDSELWAAAQAAVDHSGIPVFPAAVESAARVEWPDRDPEGFIALGVKLKVPLLYVENVEADGELLFGSVEWIIDGVTHVWEVARLVEDAGDDDSNKNNSWGWLQRVFLRARVGRRDDQKRAVPSGQKR